MKINLLFLIAIVIAVNIQAQDGWKAAISVIDNNGQPVNQAKVSIFYSVPLARQGLDPGKVTGLTDLNGIFTASNSNKTYQLRFLVEKDGYYRDNLFNDFGGVFSFKNLNPNLTFVLKKVGKPTSMYAKSLNTHVPDLDKWSVILKVVDDDGQPVTNAKTWVAYGEPKKGESSNPFQPNDWSRAGLTDTNGVFEASHDDNHSWTLGVHIQKEGYYPVSVTYELAGHLTSTPNLNIAWILKRIIKPIPMYAKRIDSLKVPELNQAIGYDLTVGDWIAPYGKGINTDLFFTEKHPDANSGYVLSISFPKRGDGIQEFNLPPTRFPGDGSALRSAQKAPINGYQSEISQTEMTNPNRNFYFRVGTKLDEDGNVVSAHYGKIYGDLAQFSYYFNPTPNDRDVEFDPKENLMTNLKFGEGVKQP